ncbi:response regulator [Clostridium tagluense]|uniref:response regulator n=1 Tax=Clostridium tagluense TaxID=360422 RepID=UPI001C0AC77E|nr:response regulator [Clostridium tagluense]MBU3130062.1 response regulator [Clostridium tagluense]MCB2313475.1 response regulator [Clostridium tagluense]MCB2318299.1 response regulator [Clostridium tagluense]MCB2323143.1 response regulator [Clostridium tagluense]MCB2328126.1 response regulator [Clostridium tagluense]
MKKVLVVDDTKNIRTLLGIYLKLNGFEVLMATNGHEALSLIDTEPVDLIFLDIKMPEISGTEVLKRIRAKGLTAPVVIMTAFATVKNAVDCTKLGAITYLQKPFTTDKIKTIIDEMIRKEEAPNAKNIKYQIMIIKQLISENNLKKALDALKVVLSTDPNTPEVYELISMVYRKQGDSRKAEIFHNMAAQWE